MKQLFFVRHGQSKGNVDKKVYYDMRDQDIELTEKGHDQAKNAGKWLYDTVVGWESWKSFDVYSSPYTRAVQTANNIVDYLASYEDDCDVTFKRQDPRLREREWGTLRDLNDSLDKGSKDHLFDFFYKPTEGESFANVYDRVACFHQWLMTQNSNSNIIIVAHGESIKCYLAYLFGWTPEDFSKYKNPNNCEIIMVNEHIGRYTLSPLTPLDVSPYYKPNKIIH
jgi:broad specificity phosphatase PhoE